MASDVLSASVVLFLTSLSLSALLLDSARTAAARFFASAFALSASAASLALLSNLAETSSETFDLDELAGCFSVALSLLEDSLRPSLEGGASSSSESGSSPSSRSSEATADVTTLLAF